MNKLILSALLCLPAAAFGQKLTAADLDERAAQIEDIGAPAPARPSPEKIMADISTALRLSSKQEDRISAAVKKRAAEFDKLLKEFEKNSAEEKRWRFKMNESRHAMVQLTRDLPDTVREFLDDEQREAFDEMLEAKRKPAGPADEAAPAPAKKKKLIKRKKAPAPEAGPAPEAAEEGGVLVDKEGAKPGPKKKKILKRKAPAKAAPAEEAPAEEPAAPAEEKEAPPAEEDAGSYP